MTNSSAASAHPTEARTTLVIATRPVLWGEVLQLLFEQEDDLSVIARAQTEDELTEALTANPPKLVLFDYESLGPGAEGAIARLRRTFPLVRILVLASRSSEDTVVAVLRAGAAGLVPKQADYQTLVTAIRAVGAGQTWANRRVTARALSELASPFRPTALDDVQLTRRELEVVDGVCRGLRNRQIAVTLGISEKTVKSHLNSIFGKIGVHSRTALARWAMDQLGPRT